MEEDAKNCCCHLGIAAFTFVQWLTKVFALASSAFVWTSSASRASIFSAKAHRGSGFREGGHVGFQCLRGGVVGGGWRTVYASAKTGYISVTIGYGIFLAQSATLTP
jgi:hypothetical protein